MKILTSIVLISLTFANLYGQSDHLHREIDKIIRYDTEIPYPLEQSFIVGIIYEDSSYILNFGPRHIDTFDLFEIGGITKVFTATLATKLDHLGIIDLKKEINKYLPQKYRNSNFDDKTLEDLLMHNLPFPKRPSDLSMREYNISNPYAYYTKEDLLQFYSTYKPRKADRFLSRSLDYSHINYGLLEIILEQETKMSLENLFQLHLFSDLAMFNTSTDFDAEHISMGFDRSNMIPEPWTYSSFAGSEGLVTCMKDLLIFTKESLSENEILIKTQELRANSKKTRSLSHTYAWYVMSSKKAGEIYTHSGVTERHKAYLHFKPESKTGVVILCDSSKGLEDLGLLILRMINDNWNK